MPFFEDFDSETLSRDKWLYSSHKKWPLSTLSQNPRTFHGKRLDLEGNSYVQPEKGKLIQYVNCSYWYDTVTSWPIWECPTNADDTLYFFVWGITLSPRYYHDSDKLSEGTGHIGFLAALCDQYEQSFFHDRRKYVSVEGLRPPSIGFVSLQEVRPVPTNSVRLRVKMQDGVEGTSYAYSDRYTTAGHPVDISWVISRDSTRVRWKESVNNVWIDIIATNRYLHHVRFRFACSWCDYSVEAVEVRTNDCFHATVPRDAHAP